MGLNFGADQTDLLLRDLGRGSRNEDMELLLIELEGEGGSVEDLKNLVTLRTGAIEM